MACPGGSLEKAVPNRSPPGNRYEHLKCKVIIDLLPMENNLLVSCARAPGINGKWQETGRSATLKFHTYGTFNAVDDMEMAVSGKDALHNDGRMRFAIIHPGSSPDIVWRRISVQGDELILISDDNKEVERYRRTR